MSMKRFTGSAWAALTTFKRFTGSAWQTLTIAKRFDGSQWVDLLDGGGGETGTITKTYALSSSQIYWSGGGQDNQKDTSGVLIHGTWTGGLSNSRRSLLWFDSAIAADLQGATIKKVELYLHREGGGHGAPTGNVFIKTHNYTTKPSKWTGADTGAADSGTPQLKRGAGTWFELLDSVGEGLRDGTVKGIALDADSSASISAYIRYLRTGSNAPKLRITYTK